MPQSYAALGRGRIGFVFIVNTDDEVDGTADAGVALWRAFQYIAEEYDTTQAFISIVNAGANFYKMTGLGPLPQSLYNGEPLQDEDFVKLEVAILQRMVDTTVELQKYVLTGMDKNAFEKKYNTIGLNIFQTHQLFCQDVLKLLPGEIGVVNNGRFLGPLDENFYAEDFYLLEKITLTSLGEEIEDFAQSTKSIDLKVMSDFVMKFDALVSSLPQSASRYDITFLKENHSVIKINSLEDDMVFDVIAIVDPLTREAQKMAQLLIIFTDLLPVQSFYRFVLEPELMLTANGIVGPAAKFLGIPEAPLLTLNMITPEGWLVEIVRSNCDLDNIHLKDVEGAVTAEYELEYLLLEGHCFDVTTEQAPRGLQFTLGTKNRPVMVDTIVMANLEVIPHMAKEYGFQYELVQYRWPRWLHQQTEKQRIIWGYKILFLDVLFPLAVDKIIFVDADQIVRHDLRELRDFDLGGAPYGYTPFCDSRKEMDGYRFWKRGYWASHLLRRKYHISALYVVDLKKFRRIAAGDRLRGQYQTLSKDPHSLSNLDQDLPNYMIYQVAIKSLPQDWLWCETWCDDESKQRAKTIDLCNNPKTKEPKLKAAARIVPEWVEYDAEIRQLLDHLDNKKTSATLLAAAQLQSPLLSDAAAPVPHKLRGQNPSEALLTEGTTSMHPPVLQ
ncbi:hypothetical protein CB1_001525019 [Camelus ferus]|nr:hypothetical protein CB1_001525019 [Camelus ferus]